MNPEQDFLTAITTAGLPAPLDLRADGLLHRYSTNGKRGDAAGWYVLHLDGIPAGAFGDWRAGMTVTWCGAIGRRLTPAEEHEYRLRIQQARALAEREREAVQAAARERAIEIWSASCAADDSHPYLAMKGVRAHGMRLHRGELEIGGMACDGALIVPASTIDGRLQTLQFIAPDGRKRFLPGGRKAGAFHLIGKLGGTLLVGEGYATAASLHECTGWSAVVAFDAGNLKPVAVALRSRMPLVRILICGDNDG